MIFPLRNRHDSFVQKRRIYYLTIAFSVISWLIVTGPAAAQVIVIGDASFETPPLAFNSFATNPSGLPWAFNQHSGIINHSNAWQSGGVPALDGNQVAYIQSAHPSSSFGTIIGMIRQPITFPVAGAYTLSYLLAGRIGPSGEGGNLPFDIYVNNVLIGSDSSTTAMAFQMRQLNFVTSAGTFDLLFQGRRPVPDTNVFLDNTAFLDKIQITPVPEPNSLVLIGVAISTAVAWMPRRRITRQSQITV